jgi:FkbM family methyltransferase
MTRTTILEIAGGARVVTPDSLNLITPYVLCEQQDWFEDEIKFLRRLLRPGQRAIDVGANYGVYTLCMAKAVGPTGSVWAFEPASSTAALLAQGIAINEFTHVVLEPTALSRVSGTAQLTLNDNSEINALVRAADSAAATETVRVDTLDECLQRFGWTDIELLKIDAEGEEANIIEGGRQFFERLSPLILYEVKAGDALHLELVAKFTELGFDSYRLVPGLDLLVPFDATSKPDGYLLNLFCCKNDRGTRLAQQGLLLTASAISLSKAEYQFDDFLEERGAEYGWRTSLAALPYAAACAHLWELTPDSAVTEALACFAISRDTQLDALARYSALESSLQSLMDLCKREPRYLRLASLARVAQDYGARTVAVSALQQLFDQLSRPNAVDLSEPFLAPGARFDTIRPRADIQDWLRACVLEELERLSAFSSFFTGAKSRGRLELLATLGYESEEMRRRLALIRSRYPQAE